jgi:hypothetical protein
MLPFNCGVPLQGTELVNVNAESHLPESRIEWYYVTQKSDIQSWNGNYFKECLGRREAGLRAQDTLLECSDVFSGASIWLREWPVLTFFFLRRLVSLCFAFSLLVSWPAFYT